MKNINIIIVLILYGSISIFAQSPKNGLIASYLLNGDTKDYSGNNNDGTLYGNEIYTEDRFGNDCGAMEFNGTDAYIKVPNSTSLQSPSKEITIALWFKTLQGQDNFKWITAICKGDQSTEDYNMPQYRMQVTQKTISVNTEFTEIHPFPFTDGKWHHYALTYDGNYVRTYFDRDKIFEYAYSGNLYSNNSPLYIGRDIPGADEYFKGALDEIMIYNRALSNKEIKKLFKDKSEKTSKKNCPGNDDDDDVVVPVDNDNNTAIPEVEITQPHKKTIESLVDLVAVKALTKNITTKKEIEISVNDKSLLKFNFNNNEIDFEAGLKPGINVITIKVKNKYGADSDVLIVNQKQNNKSNPPKVNIILPKKQTSKTSNENINFEAKVKNITSKKQIEIYLNGNKIKKFSFRKSKATASIDLIEGSNTIKIFVQNSDGSDSDEAYIQYTKTTNPPEITIIDPAKVQFDTDFPKKRISAKVTNISSKNQIEISFNNKKIDDFVFDKNAEAVNFAVELEQGQNIYIIKANNSDGTDLKYGQILYKPVTPVPAKDDIGDLIIKHEVTVHSNKVKMICFDHNKYDGDTVTVYLNDKIIFDKIRLKPKSKKAAVKTLNLEPDKEYLIISKAWNEGSRPTNTLAIEISDDNGFRKLYKLNSHKGESEALKLIYKP